MRLLIIPAVPVTLFLADVGNSDENYVFIVDMDCNSGFILSLITLFLNILSIFIMNLSYLLYYYCHCHW